MQMTITLPDSVAATLQTYAEMHGYADASVVVVNAASAKSDEVAAEVTAYVDAARLAVLAAHPELLTAVDSARAQTPGEAVKQP